MKQANPGNVPTKSDASLAGLRRDIADSLIADYGNHTAEWAYFRDILLTPAL